MKIDLEILADLVNAWSPRFPILEEFDAGGLVQEFSDSVRAELDYRREAANEKLSGDVFANQRGFKIPYVIDTMRHRRDRAGDATCQNTSGGALIVKQISAPPRLDVTVQRFVDTLQGPPIYTLSPDVSRKGFEDAQSSASVTKMPVDIQDTIISGDKTGDVSVRIFRPKDSTGTLPAVLYLHGGGWVVGSKETHDRLVREIACAADVAVVFVNYTRSPEAKYPTALEQSYAVAQHLAKYGPDYKIDASRLAVAGDSAGGNIAAALTILSKERGGPHLCYQVLLYPVTDASLDTGSYREFADGPRLTKKAMEWFWNAYEPSAASIKDPTLSPLQAAVEELRSLPPALVITDENDVLRDEGEAYAHKLMQAGVPVKAFRVLGTIHDFMVLNALAGTSEARFATAAVTTELRQSLH